MKSCDQVKNIQETKRKPQKRCHGGLTNLVIGTDIKYLSSHCLFRSCGLSHQVIKLLLQ
jgi:hypothetical protein